MSTAVVLLIETHGKQEFLFSSGKRRESVGASQLIVDVPGWAGAHDPAATLDAGAPVEVLLSAAGTFLALCRDADTARGIVAKVTRKALSDVPGLGVTGVVGKPFVWNEQRVENKADQGAGHAVGEVFALMAEARAKVAPPAARFGVLPVTALCPSSGLPVARMVKIGENLELRSEVSAAKWQAADNAMKRLAADSGLSEKEVRRAIDLLDGGHKDSPDRVAIVHADGDGLGSIVSGLRDYLDNEGPTPDSDYAKGYRAFSAGLDTASKQAFREAVAEIREQRGKTPDVLPLVLGGDDLTFIADAAIAPDLTRSYLRRFIQLTAQTAGVSGPVKEVNGGDPRLGVSAGMVIVPPHYPFAAGYRLAEELMTEFAKLTKTMLLDTDGKAVPCLSLAAHVHLDSTPGTADQLRDMLSVKGGLLTAAPYVELVDVDGVPERNLLPASKQWLDGRELSVLLDLVATLSELDSEGRKRFPSAQVHELRARLRPEPTPAKKYLERLIDADKKWKKLGLLFTEREGEPATVMLLDAMALSPFLIKENANA